MWPGGGARLRNRERGGAVGVGQGGRVHRGQGGHEGGGGRERVERSKGTPGGRAVAITRLELLLSRGTLKYTVRFYLVKAIFISKNESAKPHTIVKPKSSPKSRSQIQVPNLKSKVQRKGTGTGADNIVLQATHHPPVTFRILSGIHRSCWIFPSPLIG